MERRVNDFPLSILSLKIKIYRERVRERVNEELVPLITVKIEKKKKEFVPNGCWLVFPQFHP